MFQISLKKKWKKVSDTLFVHEQVEFLKDSIKVYNANPENFFLIYIGIVFTSIIFYPMWDVVPVIVAVLVCMLHVIWQSMKYLKLMLWFKRKWYT